MSGHFHLFVCGPLCSGGSPATVAAGARRVGPASVGGTLYDTGDGYPALVLAGAGRVQGEIWRCPALLLERLDEQAGVEERLFRRVGVRIGERACWTYVAGPRLARRLTADRSIAGGVWPRGPGLPTT